MLYMSKNNTLLAIILLFPSGLMAQTSQPWSLKDCIDYSIEHNIQLKIERLSLEESNVNVKSATAALFPHYR